MALNAALLNLGAGAMQTAAAYAALHTAQPNTSGSNPANSDREAISWVTPANGSMTLASPLHFSGGTPGGPATHLGFWSTAGSGTPPTGGTFYGWVLLAGDAAFNASGLFDVSDVTIPLTTDGGYPNESNTGPTGDLTPMSGGTISQNGATIEDKLVTGQLRIEANNVTIRNCRINTNDYFGVYVFGTGCLIEDTKIVGTSPQTLAGIALGSGDYIVRRCDVSVSEDGVRMGSNCQLLDSYVHDLESDEDAHFDTVTADGFTGWTIRHNRLENPNGWTGVIWVGDPRYGPSEGIVEDNYLAGAGYTIYGGPGTGDGIRVINNVFSTKFFPDCGYYGHCVDWDTDGNTWSGNTWYDGPNVGETVDYA